MRFIEKPFLFNPLKHHLSYQKEFIRCFGNDISSLKLELATIGSSQMDVYCGPLGSERISLDIYKLISCSFKVNYLNYNEFLLQYNNFFVVSISDHSKWVLRKGIDPDRYIHFHPARYSPHTFRVNANTLKTLMAAGIIADQTIGLTEINSARRILDLDPVDKLTPTQGIGKFLMYYT